MFNPKIFLSSNLRTSKQDNALITQSSVRNKAINLLDWFGIDLTNGSSSLVLAQNGTWVSNAPFAPTNSIQYNNNGSFFGDSKFLRDPSTKETIIQRVPTFGTDGGFVLNTNLPFISSFLGLSVEGTELYWQDNVSGYGASVAVSNNPGTIEPSVIGLIGNVNNGDAAVFGLGFDTATHSWAFNASGNNSTSNTTAQINAQADDTTSKAEIEAENIGNGDISKFSCEPSKALAQYINGVDTNTMIVDATGIHFTFGLGGMQINNVPAYIDDAAAIVGGLTSGYLYKTTIAGSTFLKIIP